MVGQDVSIMFQLWRHNVHNRKGHWSNINLSRQNTKTLFFGVRSSIEKGLKTPRPSPFWQISNWKVDQISLLLFENTNCHLRGICKLWMFPEHFQLSIKLVHSTSFWKLTFPSMHIRSHFSVFQAHSDVIPLKSIPFLIEIKSQCCLIRCLPLKKTPAPVPLSRVLKQKKGSPTPTRFISPHRSPPLAPSVH